MKLHYKLFCKKYIFLFSTRVEENKSHVKVQYIVMNIQINTIKWNKVILEKFGKNKYQIWSFNQVEKPITDFNSGLKRKDELCICASSTWTTIGQINLNANMYHNRTNAPVVTSAQPVAEVLGSNSRRTMFFSNLGLVCIKCILVLIKHIQMPSAVVGLLCRRQR